MSKLSFLLFICFIKTICFSQTKELETFLKTNNSRYDSLLKKYPAQTYLEPPKTKKNDSLGIKSNYSINDTIYFDKDWKECEKVSALYFRLITTRDSLYQVNDYYLDGTLQMSALCSSINPEIKHGLCTYYHPNGKRERKGMYYNDKPIGVWNYYNKRGINYNYYDYSFEEVKSFDSSSWKSINQSSLFIGNINYRFKINKGSINSGHGFGIEAGLNLGYFFSQKLLAAPFLGWGMRDILYNTRFNSNYLNDFNNNYNGTSLTGNDSIAINYMADLMNKKGYFHDLTTYYGLMIKLPFNYMPIVKIYRGNTSLSYKTLNETIQLEPRVSSDKKTDKDYYDISRKMNWGVELFLYNGHTQITNYGNTSLSAKIRRKYKWSINALAFSIYAEEYDTYHSRFSFSDGYHNIDVPMESFMNKSFMNKYKKEYYVGLRLSCGIF